MIYLQNLVWCAKYSAWAVAKRVSTFATLCLTRPTIPTREAHLGHRWQRAVQIII